MCVCCLFVCVCVCVCVCVLCIITARTLLPCTAPAPRLSGTPGEVKETVEVVPGLHSREILQELGYLKEVCSESLTVCMYQGSLKLFWGIYVLVTTRVSAD